MAFTTGYLSLGSNLGDRLANLRSAVTCLVAGGKLSVLRRSSVYETLPWGYNSDREYYNAVIEILWGGTPSQLLMLVQQVEQEMWRLKQRRLPYAPYSDRTIDIDILWLEGVKMHTPSLTLPHHLAHMRAFVLIPWNEIAPEMTLNGLTIAQLIAALPDTKHSQVKRICSL